jgi:hypothetical protein
VVKKFIQRFIVGAWIMGLCILVTNFIDFTDNLLPNGIIYADILELQLVFITMFILGFLSEVLLNIVLDIKNLKNKTE